LELFDDRMPTVTRRLRSLGTFLLLTAGALSLGCKGRDRGPLLRDADMPTLERQGDSLRATLERYRQQHAAYPATLAEAGLGEAAWTTPFGPWRYARAGEGEAVAAECRGTYALSVGDYDRHHFELCWAWGRQEWGWNR
jgi:hypothetical protein